MNNDWDSDNAHYFNNHLNTYVKKNDFIMWDGFGDAPSKQVYY